MRRIRTILAFAPVVSCVALWVASYTWIVGGGYDGGGGRASCVYSGVGGVYAATGPAQFGGGARWVGEVIRRDETRFAIEDAFGTTQQWWKPVRMLRGPGGIGPVLTVVVVPWWFVTLASAAPVVWRWRRGRRRDAGRGFEVERTGATRS